MHRELNWSLPNVQHVVGPFETKAEAAVESAATQVSGLLPAMYILIISVYYVTACTGPQILLLHHLQGGGSCSLSDRQSTLRQAQDGLPMQAAHQHHLHHLPHRLGSQLQRLAQDISKDVMSWTKSLGEVVRVWCC